MDQGLSVERAVACQSLWGNNDSTWTHNDRETIMGMTRLIEQVWVTATTAMSKPR